MTGQTKDPEYEDGDRDDVENALMTYLDILEFLEAEGTEEYNEDPYVPLDFNDYSGK